MIDEPEPRECSTCRAVKPVSDFAPRIDRPSSRRSRCHACDNAAERGRYRRARAAAGPVRPRARKTRPTSVEDGLSPELRAALAADREADAQRRAARKAERAVPRVEVEPAPVDPPWLKRGADGRIWQVLVDGNWRMNPVRPDIERATAQAAERGE